MNYRSACAFRTFLAMGISLVLAAAGCSDSDRPESTGEPDGFTVSDPDPVLQSVEVPTPLLPGSPIEIRGLGLPLLGEPLNINFVFEDGVSWTAPMAFDPSTGLWTAAADITTGQASQGVLTADVRVLGTVDESSPITLTAEVARALSTRIAAPSITSVHYGTSISLDGSGFPLGAEGESELVFDGTFDDGSAELPIRISLPLATQTRQRASFSLPPELADLRVGRLSGSIRAGVSWLSGDTTESEAVPIDASLTGPVVYGITSPTPLTVGRAVRIEGAGFIADPAAGALTELHLTGMFTSSEGTELVFDDEAYPLERVEGGALALLPMTPLEDNGRLIVEMFGANSGTFEGTGYVITSFGSSELSSEPLPLSLRLDGTDQVVWVRFTSGFYTSLSRFGLGGVPSSVEAAVFSRLEAIYADYRIEFVSSEPSGMATGAYSIVEVGGPDPNGIGLLGYDNTPGKDVGNVRLGDRIGGENAETQEDGYPGFGGVFIESMLYWSAHPGFDATRPAGAPDPDPLFDEIFDPVRSTPAGASAGNEARAAQEQRAIEALGNAIGETIAHEVGHSLGLAEPYGSDGVYHNNGDSPGCLMDRGEDRPLGERLAEPGFAATRLCGDAEVYLEAILGRR